MNLLATIALDFVLLFVVLFSVHAACAWGELCGIRPGRDKSGLGGFAAMFLLTGIRWLGVALVLLAVARPGEGWWLLGGHLVLGGLATTLFQHGLRRVHDDRQAPLGFGLVAGVLLPLPALALAIVRANVDGPAESPTALGVVAGLLLVLHGACFRHRRADVLRSGHR